MSLIRHVAWWFFLDLSIIKKNKKKTKKKKLHSLWDCCRPWFHIEIKCYVSLWEKDHTSHLIYCHSEPFPNEFMVSVLSFGSHDPIHPLFITTLFPFMGSLEPVQGQVTPWTSRQLIAGPFTDGRSCHIFSISILLKDTSTCDLPITSRPALLAKLQPRQIMVWQSVF